MADSPFGAIPSGADIYAAAQARLAASQAAAQQPTPEQHAAALVQPTAPVSPAQVDPFADYRERDGVPLTFELYDGDKPFTATVDDLQRPDVANYRVTVRTPDGERRGVAAKDVSAAIAQGMKLETAPESRIARFVEENDNLPGATKVALMEFANQFLLGVPGVVAKHTKDPEDMARLEALKAEHEYANAAGGLAGFGTGILLGSPVFKVAGEAGKATSALVTRAAEKALATRLAGTGVSGSAKAIAKKIVAGAAGSGAGLGVESAILAAPQAVTEAALGDPEAAGETMLWNLGAGVALGTTGGAAKALFRSAFDGVRGLRFSRAVKEELSQAARAEGQTAVTATLEEAAPAAAAAAEGNVATQAVDATGEAYIKAQKGLSTEQRDALTRVLKDDAASAGRQEEMLDELARQWKKTADVAMKVDDEVLPRIAFGEGKAEQMAALVDTELTQESRAVAMEAGGRVKSVVEELAGLADKGGSAGVVKRLETAFEAFKQKLPGATSAVTPEAQRDLFIALDKLKRDVGRQAGMGLKPYQRNFAQQQAFDLYHELIKPLQNEAAWGPAAIAQREINEATTDKLATSDKFRQSFIENFETRGGNALSEFDPADIKKYLRNILGAENDNVEKALRNWVSGLENQMAAVEKHYTLSPAETAQFAEARKALESFKAGVNEAKANARSIATIQRMQADEGRKALGGIIGLAADAWTRPTTVVERIAAARKFTLRLEQSGILTTEQALKREAKETMRIGNVVSAMGQGVKRVADAAEGLGAAFAPGAPRALSDIFQSKGDLYAQYEHAAEKLDGAMAAFERTDARTSDLAGFLADGGAPNVAAALAGRQRIALDYLQKTMPRPRTPPALFGSKVTTPPPKYEILAWERRVEVVANPYSVISHLATGTLAPEHIDALRTVYPKTAEKIASRLAMEAAKPDAPVLTEGQRTQILALMGVPDGSRASMRRYQQHFTEAPENPDAPGAPGGVQADFAGLPSAATDVQRVSGK